MRPARPPVTGSGRRPAAAATRHGPPTATARLPEARPAAPGPPPCRGVRAEGPARGAAPRAGVRPCWDSVAGRGTRDAFPVGTTSRRWLATTRHPGAPTTWVSLRQDGTRRFLRLANDEGRRGGLPWHQGGQPRTRPAHPLWPPRRRRDKDRRRVPEERYASGHGLSTVGKGRGNPADRGRPWSAPRIPIAG